MVSSPVAADHAARAKRRILIATSLFSAGLLLLIWTLIDGNALGWAARSIVERFVGASSPTSTLEAVKVRGIGKTAFDPMLSTLSIQFCLLGVRLSTSSV